MPPSGEVPDVLAMEYATGILLAESAVSNYGGLASNFPKQVAAMLARLEAAREARPLPEGTGALIDGIFRRAQERVLLAQVAREIQVNLRRMEQMLDAFFRDPDEAVRDRGARQGQPPDPRRAAHAGAGRRRTPARPLRSADRELREPGHPGRRGRPRASRRVAVGLGFFVEALEQQRSDRKRLIAPLLARASRRGPGSAG